MGVEKKGREKKTMQRGKREREENGKSSRRGQKKVNEKHKEEEILRAIAWPSSIVWNLIRKESACLHVAAVYFHLCTSLSKVMSIA